MQAASIPDKWPWVQDLPRTFPSQPFVASTEGQAALRQVLVAFSVHRPEVGYCQGMNYLTAMLLCTMQHRREDAFWMLAALIDDGGANLAKMGGCLIWSSAGPCIL